MAPKKLEKKLRKEEKVKKAIVAFTCLMTMSCNSVEEKTETDSLRPVFSSEKVET